MRLVDFVTQLLEAQAQTLQRLAAFFGEEELLEMLEAAGDRPDPKTAPIKKEWFHSDTVKGKVSAYAELEGAVRDLKLPAVLEFHLWAYPYYRSIIESSIGLNAKINEAPNHSKTNPIELLVQDATLEAKNWVQRLPIPPAVSAAAETAAQVPWLRFRTEILRKTGNRPFTAVKNMS